MNNKEVTHRWWKKNILKPVSSWICLLYTHNEVPNICRFRCLYLYSLHFSAFPQLWRSLLRRFNGSLTFPRLQALLRLLRSVLDTVPWPFFRLRCGREWLMMANPWCFIAWSWNPGLRIMSRRMGDVMRTVVRIPRGRMVRCQHKSRSLRAGIGMYDLSRNWFVTKKTIANCYKQEFVQQVFLHFSLKECFFLGCCGWTVVVVVVKVDRKNPQVLSGFWVALRPWSSSKHC